MAFHARNIEAVHENLLCAYYVLRELRDQAPHYRGEARREMVAKAIAALRQVWETTGAEVKDMVPKMRTLIASGRICQDLSDAAK